MTIKKRLIPKLLISFRKRRGNIPFPVLVISDNFERYRTVGDPLSQAKIFESQMADEIILVNLCKDKELQPYFIEILSKFQKELSTPLNVGGSIRTIRDVEELLQNGADKVLLNTHAIQKPDLINTLVSEYGSQCITLGIDISTKDNKYRIKYSSGKENADIDAIQWMKESVERGAGEILLTSIAKDGKCDGYDLELLDNFTNIIETPIIISGGCGAANHFNEAFKKGASGATASSFFFKRDQNLMQCRSFLKAKGVEMRDI